jgi:hypothetical protein
MEFKYRSEEINQIMGALSRAQGSYKKLIANVFAAGGDYANLDATLAAVKDSLAANELAFWQHVEILEEGSGAGLLVSTLGHSSGQYISSYARVYAGETDRATGVTIENHKRQHAQSLLGIAPSPHDPVAFDDDGAEEFERNLTDQMKKPSKDRKIGKNIPITKDQYNLLIDLLGNDKTLYRGVLDWHKLETLQDLPAHEFNEARTRIVNAQKAVQDAILARR